MSNHSSYTIFIFTALECEAKPLINFFALKKDIEHRAFALYKNDNIILTISGVGKVAMAGAVAYSMAVFHSIELPIMINIGIAGHKTLELGCLCLAVKVIDEDTGRRFYPQYIGKDSVGFSVLNTCSHPTTNYDSDHMYDMEASAFYEMAVRFSSSELIHCMKIISDNQNSKINNINPQVVSVWIGNQINNIERLLKCLLKQQQVVSNNELAEYNEILNDYRFTVSGQLKLKALLMRWKVLSVDNLVINSEKKMTAKAMLKYLEQHVEQLEVHL